MSNTCLQDPPAAATALVVAAADGGERVLRWAGLGDEAARAAAWLRSLGVTPGDRVVVAVPNGVDHVATTTGAWLLGAEVVPLSPQLVERERAQLLGLAAGGVVVAEPGWAEGAVDPAARGSYPAEPVTGAIVARVRLATGGSTGTPRLQPQRTLDPGPDGIGGLAALGLRPGLHQLVPGPLHHSFPFEWAYRGLLAQCPLVLVEHFDAARVVDLVRRHGVGYLGLVPTMMARIARLDGLDPACLDSVETVLHTGGPCPAWVKRAWLDLVGPRRLLEAYGGADSRTCTLIRGDEWLTHEGSVGRPVTGSVVVRDPQGSPVPPGVVGSVFLAAEGDTDGTSIGDLGRLDADGYLYLADRRCDLVVTGGVNVYPAEVEAVLGEHPDVVDAVVVGVPDDEWGQRVHAVVAVRAGAGLSPEGVRAFARVRLSAPKVPRTVDLVAEIPRDGAGKVRRGQIREAARASQAGAPA